MPLYAKVIPDRSGSRALDYEIPAALETSLTPGARVRVPLRAKLVLGTVIDITSDTDARGVREIAEALGEKPMIRPELFELAKWMADYYCTTLESAMACVLPQVVRQGEVSSKRRNFARLLRSPSDDELEALTRKAPRQADALRALLDFDESQAVTKLAEAAGVSESVFRVLEKNGWVAIEPEDVARDPYGGETFLPTQDLVLNEEQQAAFEVISMAVSQPKVAKPILLHGVTGSGKTELYLRAIRQALEQGKTALVLVPEISLTPQTVERFKARFSEIQKEIAVLHSHLSDGERYDEWHKIHSGRARIVIGARSAVFAPLADLGVIIVDEEHEGSYKQEDAPRYHARDLAVLRANREVCAIVLGSATPSLESWNNYRTGKYQLLRLALRVDDRQMPVMRVVDMRRANRGGDGVLAPQLLTAIERRLAGGQQTILFLNRRGFSTVMLCKACGHVCECPECSVALTYHRDAGRLACHICGHSARAPKVCPSCKDPGIRHTGVGTQKVEDAVRRVFPKARIARMDADAMARKGSMRQTLDAFKMGNIDILVGTQMIAKGLHFPNVTLVGIVNADLGLHVPDFRAGERTFQLLTQVAGRAGRGELEGEVVVQTVTPFSPSIQFARHHDFEGFVEQELDLRQRFDFPPFSRMVLLTVRSRVVERAEFTAQTLVRRLKEKLPAGVALGEAMAAPLAKAKSYFRFQTTMRGPTIRPMARCIQEVLAKLPPPEDVFITVDVDPVQLL